MVIGVTGGIGTGKSLICNILRTMGYPVFDCDSEARRIMDNDTEIHRKLCEHIHQNSVVNNVVNRKLISDVVFNSKDKLNKLNSIVHGAVFNELRTWIGEQEAKPAFVESAILRSSGLIDLVDQEWIVRTEIDVRIQRVMKRSSLTHDEIMSRIISQNQEFSITTKVPSVFISNSPNDAVLPQLHNLLNHI